ncbi:MAG: DMT family transporter [Pseudomonadota bacterium]
MTKRMTSALLRGYQPSWPFILAILGSSLMGLSPIFVRMTDIGPNALGLYRMLFALPFIWIWKTTEETQSPFKKPTFAPKDHLLLAIAGLSFAIDLGTWHLSIRMTEIINAALLNNLTPFFVPLALWALFKERPRFIFMLAIMWVFVGAAILTGESFSIGYKNVLGDALATFSALAFTGYILAVKQLRLRFNAPTIILGTSLWMIPFLLLFTIFFADSWKFLTTYDWIAIFGLALIVQVGSQGLLAYSMGHLTAGLVAITMLISPAVSAISARVIFGEEMSLWQILGVVIVISGIIIARQDERKHDQSLKE